MRDDFYASGMCVGYDEVPVRVWSPPFQCSYLLPIGINRAGRTLFAIRERSAAELIPPRRDFLKHYNHEIDGLNTIIMKVRKKLSKLNFHYFL